MRRTVLEALREFFFGPAPVRWLQDLLEPLGPAPFRALSLLGDTWGLLLVLGLAFWLWGRRTLYALIPLLAIEASTYLLVNQILEVPRPTRAEVVVYENLSMSAFPSGHTYLTTVLWGFLYWMGRIPISVASAAVLAVALGRLFLGVHHLGDIVGACILGALLVAVYRPLWRRLGEWLARPPFAVYAAVAAVLALATIVALPSLARNPRWAASAGIVIGAAVALPLEYATVRFAPTGGGRRARMLHLLIGAAGLLVALYIGRALPASATSLLALVSAVAAIWIFLATPLLLERLGPAPESIAGDDLLIGDGSQPRER